MKRNKGFTLVELLAVIVILAIIMVISIPAVLNIMTSAKRKTFGEYVTKVYDAAQKKYMSDEMLGESKSYAKYDITKDLGLDNTGDYRGYVVFYKNGLDTDVYIGLSDNEYHTATQFGDDEANIVNYINYSKAGEPEYAYSLEKFDGKKNSFTNGKVEDFNFPEQENVEDFVQIETNLNPKDDFALLLKNFRNQARSKFKNSKDMNDGLVYKSPIRETDKDGNIIEGSERGFTYVAGFTYDSIFGTSSDKKGFVYMFEIVPKLDGIIDNSGFDSLKFEVIALKNNEYHTASNIAVPDTSSSTEAYNNQITPVNIIITYNDVSITYNPTETTELSEMNFMKVYSSLISRIQKELELEEDECSCELTDVQKEKIIKIITTSLNTDFTAAQQFVKNDYNDGLNDNSFDLVTYASAEDSPLKIFSSGVTVSISPSEAHPMGK